MAVAAGTAGGLGSALGWPAAIRRLLRQFSFSQRPGFQCLPLVVEGQQVGLVMPAVARELRAFPDVFVEVAGGLELRGGRCPEERTEAVAGVLAQLRTQGRLARLAKWRDEAYEVRPSFGAPALFNVERAAAALLGVLQFGAHLNAFVHRQDDTAGSRQMFMWLARRSPHKATYPGLLDNLAAGGISAGLGVKETMVKESWEEARVPPELAAQAQPVGSLSYTYEEMDGEEFGAVVRECLFIFDLEVPEDFTPQVREAVNSDSFKPNCALVVVDFLFRHGLLHPDQEPLYPELMAVMHQAL
ncbi:nudix hydrolase 24, chloroplastic-like isoform X2 [Trichosurus vulpecula]|uniref:nudix hydrolase 24, chloroplastic-like isoform X2 n=1 Tax=Trichosurus vulpecula TaxID=9337 RepID=UPI00186AEFA4|nr:nudix hydrolase 24, chloroplastic-like isoform X2 [Trichosurus vulpecula]